MIYLHINSYIRLSKEQHCCNHMHAHAVQCCSLADLFLPNASHLDDASATHTALRTTMAGIEEMDGRRAACTLSGGSRRGGRRGARRAPRRARARRCWRMARRRHQRRRRRGRLRPRTTPRRLPGRTRLRRPRPRWRPARRWPGWRRRARRGGSSSSPS